MLIVVGPMLGDVCGAIGSCMVMIATTKMKVSIFERMTIVLIPKETEKNQDGDTNPIMMMTSMII